ncbi:MAG: helix-turn-helix domain-containing protein [Sporichthyaceae bacterium]
MYLVYKLVWVKNHGMTDVSLIDPPADIAVGTRRAEVLGMLRDAGGPLSVAQVAEGRGLHVNTARFHLDGLVSDGLAERTAEERDTRGRPRILFTARAEASGPRSFRFLAEMLTGLVASLDGAGPAAVEAGRAWGRHLVDRPAPSQRVDTNEATARLNRMLDAIGFQPEAYPEAGGVQLRLRHCPFREVAERHTDVVCEIHLGLMQGALGELRAPLKAESVEPFVTPSLCVSHLRAVGAAA